MAGISVSSNVKDQVQSILKLLEQTTSKDVVTEFLQSKNLHFSGTWVELFEKRVYPAVETGKIEVKELIDLLSKSEETGRQHVFLYQIPKDTLVTLTKDTLLKRVKSAKLDALVDSPIILNMPDKQTVTAVRFEANGSFIIKAISTRTRYEYQGDDITKDGYLNKRYKIIKSRSICLLKMHSSGLVEVRISSKSHTTKYHEDVEEFLKLTDTIIPISKIRSYAINLSKSKTNIWDKRIELSGVLRFSDATLKDSMGYTVRAATGDRDSDLLANKSVAKSMEQFSGSDVHCETNNIFFKTIENQTVPSREVHVLMSGEMNEFTITAYCKDSDYEYVFKNILAFNAK
jgi:hypothetical protein